MNWVKLCFADPAVISDEFRYHYKPRTNPREQVQLLIIQNLLLILNIIQGGIDCIYHPRKLIYKLYEGVPNSNFDNINLQSENCLFLFIIKEPCHYPLISLIRSFVLIHYNL